MSFAGNLFNKYGKKLLVAATKTGPDAAKTTSKNVVHKMTEPAAGLIENTIPKNLSKQNLHLTQIRGVKTSILKWKIHKICKLLNDSTVSKFAKRKWIEVNDLSDGQHSVKKNLRFQTSMFR